MTVTSVVPRYIRNSFSLTYARQPQIRRQANEFEDTLRENYGQPQVFPVPDELDPRVPRILFSSTHGFSQISVSQISTSLTVKYSEDWQVDREKRRAYLQERTDLVFDALEKSGQIEPLYTGLSTLVHLPLEIDDHELPRLLDRQLTGNPSDDLFDVSYKRVFVIDSVFFHNVVVESYRTWKKTTDDRYRSADAIARGISISGDFNDRYAFNEIDGYTTSRELSERIIEEGLNAIDRVVEKLLEICE
jgi:hypothetical protein